MAGMLRRDFLRQVALAGLGAAAAPGPSIAAPAGPTVGGGAPVAGNAPVARHGLSIYGELKYGPDFRHFDYVNPKAPRGGDVRLPALGTFDTLNPFVIKGVPAAGIGEVFESLTVAALDEPNSQYGLIAESVEVPGDRSWVAFTLNAAARFHDGSPITVADVIWSFDTLKARGRPFFRSYYRSVVKAEAVGPRTVRFAFAGGMNRELPLIVSQLPVLSRAYWATRDFTRTTVEPPLGSGPYRVEAAEPGRSITYRRVHDYWAAALPVNVGRDNFDVLRYDYYRDGTVSLEAFKAGAYDFRQENSAKSWATGYDFPALKQGFVKKEQIENEVPTGMQAFVFNTRRPFFADPRVRDALTYAFDFEWTNQHLFYGSYTRTKSYFSNSELAARGLPGPEELAILEPYRGRVPEPVFTKAYEPPTTDGSGHIRANIMTALRTLGEAGWTVKDQKLVHAQSGQPMRFEILLNEQTWERISLPFVKNLARLGVEARLRVVDTPQYQYRTDNFDFDMLVNVWGESLSPGNEQRNYWGSRAASEPGSENVAGIRDPVVDELIELVIAAPDRPALIARTRCLDRVLLWGHYVIPQWHIQAFRVAYWNKFGRPAVAPKYAVGFDTWWVDPARAAALPARGQARP
jgi:microcin C transport system substrate-binding protein